ncbi:MAG: hypothetical protein P1U54_09195 [Immundisolibacteraceae bacterium]|nr:hypothetical protein [Immundisolibacteraceae bacterium]
MNAPLTSTPHYMSRADGMSDEYVAAATKLVSMTFQSLCSLQMHVLDAPAHRRWADDENRIVRREMAERLERAREIAENLLPDLGVEPEAMREEAEASLTSGRKLRLDTIQLESWNDGLVYRMLYGLVLTGQLSATIGSNYLPYSNIAQKLYFKHCLSDWPGKVGSPHLGRVATAIEEDGVDALQAVVDRWWPLAIDSFGADGSANEKKYMELGLKTRPNAMCRELFVERATATFDQLGLKIPA